MGEWMQKYNDAERQLDRYRIQATKIGQLYPQKIQELEERARDAERKLVVEKNTVLRLEKRMTDTTTAVKEVVSQREQLQATIIKLRLDIAEKEAQISSISTELEEEKKLRNEDRLTVESKVKVIKDCISKHIRSLECENLRLKRQVEKIESEQLNQLQTEVMRLKEINQSQARDRIAIFEEAYKKCCRDMKGEQERESAPPRYNSPKQACSPQHDALSPIYQGTSSQGTSTSSSDPLYAAIARNKQCSGSPTKLPLQRTSAIDRPALPPPFSPGSTRISPPLPPRRTSASKTSVEQQRKKLPSSSGCCSTAQMCCPITQSIYDPPSQFSETLSPGGTIPRSSPPSIPPPFKSSSNSSPHSFPPPLSQREEGDGSVSNDYDEIPTSPIRTPTNSQHFINEPVRFRSNSGSKTSQQRTGVYKGSSTYPSNSIPSNNQNGKRGWHALVDNMALVGFTDILPQQRCVKSSIGKVPIYTVLEPASNTEHPYEEPPVEPPASPEPSQESITEFERILDKMKVASEVQRKQLLSSPLLAYSSNPLIAPLSHIPAQQAVHTALKINRLLLNYTQNPTDYMTTTTTLRTLTSAPLVNEVYAQLVKQTHRQPAEMLTYWQMLALIIPFSIPTGRVLLYLRDHLNRYSEQKTSAGRFAGYCAKVLHRREAFGPRQGHPSRLEIEATCLYKPYAHSKPMSIPIHLPGDDYQVTGFDTVSSVSEVLRELETSLGLRTSRWSGFALFMDDPVNPEVKVPVSHSAKLCDVIAKWEAAVKPSSSSQVIQVVGLSYLRFLHLTSTSNTIANLEYKLLALQTHSEAMVGQHGMNVELATCLGAMLAKALEGNCTVNMDSQVPVSPKDFKPVIEAMKRYVPDGLLNACGDIGKRQAANHFAEIWIKFKDSDQNSLYKKYVTVCKRWKYNNCTLFRGLLLHGEGLKLPVCVCVSEKKIVILNVDTQENLDTIYFVNINTFGGYPFTISVLPSTTGLKRTVSVMLVDKYKCFLLTELIASYCRLSHVLKKS